MPAASIPIAMEPSANENRSWAEMVCDRRHSAMLPSVGPAPAPHASCPVPPSSWPETPSSAVPKMVSKMQQHGPSH